MLIDKIGTIQWWRTWSYSRRICLQLLKGITRSWNRIGALQAEIRNRDNLLRCQFQIVTSALLRLVLGTRLADKPALMYLLRHKPHDTVPYLSTVNVNKMGIL
jgi:hypothetical protein